MNESTFPFSLIACIYIGLHSLWSIHFGSVRYRINSGSGDTGVIQRAIVTASVGGVQRLGGGAIPLDKRAVEISPTAGVI